MQAAEAGPSSRPVPPPSWLKAIDNTYALFEEAENKAQFASLAPKIEHAVTLCEEVIDEIGLNHFALSFNGGKDCTVLVHILAAVLRRKKRRASEKLASNRTTDPDEDESGLLELAALYITSTSPFQEVEDFVAESIWRYNLRLVRESGDMKEALEQYLNGDGEEAASKPGGGMKLNGGEATAGRQEKQHHAKRDVRAIFVGTRRTDPHGADLKARKKTDPGWPEVERIQPILDWSYKDVWDFLRCPLFAVSPESSRDAQGREWGASYGIPYCTLYDEGYTSLGSTFNTFPNPLLDTRKGQPIDSEDVHHHRWLPAFRLEDGSQERAGRQSKAASS